MYAKIDLHLNEDELDLLYSSGTTNLDDALCILATHGDERIMPILGKLESYIRPKQMHNIYEHLINYFLDLKLEDEEHAKSIEILGYVKGKDLELIRKHNLKVDIM